jgi:ankyrin repeat protein
MDLLANKGLPSSRVVFWCHITGKIAPNCITEDILKFPDKFVFTTPVSKSIPIYLKLQEKDKKNIGQPLLTMIDDEYNTPLFYAVEFENIEALNIILSYSKNIFHMNKEGNTVIHIAVIINNIETSKMKDFSDT